MTISKKNSLLALATVALLAVSVLPANAATKAKPTTTPKPTVSTAPRAGGFGGGANNPAFAKYTACLAKAGIKLPSFGGGRGFGTPGTRPTGAPTGAPSGTAPRPRPTFSMTPAQQKAFTACAALRPSAGGFGADGRSGGIAPKTGTSPAYIACLNTHGIPVKTAAEIAGLDSQNTKVIAAKKACAGK